MSMLRKTASDEMFLILSVLRCLRCCHLCLSAGVSQLCEFERQNSRIQSLRPRRRLIMKHRGHKDDE
jgi:hypothetical protein